MTSTLSLVASLYRRIADEARASLLTLATADRQTRLTVECRLAAASEAALLLALAADPDVDNAAILRMIDERGGDPKVHADPIAAAAYRGALAARAEIEQA